MGRLGLGGLGGVLGLGCVGQGGGQSGRGLCGEEGGVLLGRGDSADGQQEGCSEVDGEAGFPDFQRHGCVWCKRGLGREPPARRLP